MKLKGWGLFGDRHPPAAGHCRQPLHGRGADRAHGADGAPVAVAQVALHEHMACIAAQAGEVFEVAGVGQFVEIDNGVVASSQLVEHEIAADEPCAAGDEDHYLASK